MEPETKFPYVRCAEHPNATPEPGYIVCPHVMEGAEIGYREAASPTDMGVLVCKECCKLAGEDQLEALRVQCIHGLRQRGLVPAA